MCTLIAVHRHVPGRALLIAANRDEYFDRESEGPALRAGIGGAIVAPLDLRAGGTWLGLNGSGVFAALTNVRSENPDASRLSRGQIVLSALAEGSAEAAARKLQHAGDGLYNSFNCFIADGRSAWVVVYQDRPRLHALEPGVHVIGNIAADETPSEKIERIQREANVAAELPPDEVFGALGALCGKHGDGTGASNDPLRDTCVHAGGTYGTRSSILVETDLEGRPGRLHYAEGAPCKNPHEDFSALLHELRRMPGYGVAETPTRTAS